MKFIAYVFFAIAGFIVAVSSYFLFDESKKKKKAMTDNLEKARKAKLQKSKDREALSDIQKDLDLIEDLENKILEENASTKKEETAN